MERKENNKKLFLEYQKSKDRETRDKIIINNASLVKIIASKMYVKIGGAIEKNDLESIGILGLIDAIDRYDVSKDTTFETYASIRIQGYILDEIRKMDWVPRSVRTMEKNIEKITNDYLDHTGKKPTDEQLAEELNISTEKLYQHQSLLIRNNITSLDANLELDESETDKYEVIIDPKELTPEEFYLRKEEVPKLLKEALEILTENERKVILMMYYEDMTMNEIAEVMNISGSRVSQLHKKALEKMKNSMQGCEELMLLFK